MAIFTFRIIRLKLGLLPTKTHIMLFQLMDNIYFTAIKYTKYWLRPNVFTRRFYVIFNFEVCQLYLTSSINSL